MWQNVCTIITIILSDKDNENKVNVFGKEEGY